MKKLKKIDFTAIGRASEVFDTDAMDIGRRMLIELPDGSKVETNPEIPLYKDVPCHIDFNTTDNPDTSTVDVRPIIISITLHCSTAVDLKNGDLIYAKRLDPQGNIMHVYRGIIGEPAMSQARQSALMGVAILQ